VAIDLFVSVNIRLAGRIAPSVTGDLVNQEHRRFCLSSSPILPH
jgi:hypothetical protein